MYLTTDYLLRVWLAVYLQPSSKSRRHLCRKIVFAKSGKFRQDTSVQESVLRGMSIGARAHVKLSNQVDEKADFNLCEVVPNLTSASFTWADSLSSLLILASSASTLYPTCVRSLIQSF